MIEAASREPCFRLVEPQDNPPEATEGRRPAQEPLGNNEELSLDAGSMYPEGTQKEIDNPFQMGPERRIICVHEGFRSESRPDPRRRNNRRRALVFQLTVQNGTAVDTAEVHIEVEPGDGEG